MAMFAVKAYGVYCNITFPLIVKVFKPLGTLKAEDKYQTKIELAAEIIKELIKEGFNIKLVLADSLYGEQVGACGSFRPGAKLCGGRIPPARLRNFA